MDPADIQIEPYGKNIRFTNSKTGCVVVFNTSNAMAYNLAEFNCGNRGGGNGAKLLYFALNYVTDDANIPRRNQPFRIELIAVPESTVVNNNDLQKLKEYYRSLGFQDTYQQRDRIEMDGLIANIKNKLRAKIGLSGGRKTRKNSRRRRSTRKHKK